MSKKSPQWGIDRAFNFNHENALRIKMILQCNYNVECGYCSEESGLQKIVDLGYVGSVERYKHSTQTLLNNFGLQKAMFELTDVSKAYLSNKISFDELVLLQILKKEYKYSDSSDEIIKPMMVLLGVLIELYKINPAYCWVDLYDYIKHLTEIKSYSEIPSVVKNMANEKAKKAMNRDVEFDINDFDMWTTVFGVIGILIPIDDKVPDKYVKYKFNIKYMNFAEYLWDNKDKTSVIHEYNKRSGSAEERKERRALFGSMRNGLFEIMPKFTVSNKFNLQNILYYDEDILYRSMVDGMDDLAIEKELFSTDSIGGNLAHAILESFGLNSNEVRGIFRPFKHHLHLLYINELYTDEMKEIIGKLLKKEGMETVTYEYKADRCECGLNKIYYGIPGCGKSYKVAGMLNYKEGFNNDAKLLGISEAVNPENIFRTTFYLDYSNSDFVGQLMPKTKNRQVFYEPVFGPFTKALKRACETNEMVYLVIEEINRGNAAAIFGDIFQLLDRYKDSQNGHKKGDSMYPITNDFIEDYLGIAKGTVIIPSNLTIIATMNTSDQNVFPLDTAFKRRWDRERVTPKWDDPNVKILGDMYVPYTNITWSEFAEKINKILSANSKDGMLLEDKQLGPFYIDKSSLCTKSNDLDKVKLQSFVNNVIDYLYNDVTKFDHGILFVNTNGYDALYTEIFSNLPSINVKQQPFGILCL